MPDPSPIDLGPYVPEKLLATGAHTQVWLADGPAGSVALKVARGPEHREAVLREARALEACRHPRVVRLLDSSPQGDWLALERVRGNMLDRWVVGRSVSEVVQVGLELIEALRHVHAQGIVHGDLKPANVLIDRAARVQLLDLGVATLPDEDVQNFRGTLGFAAPELLRGVRPSARSDVYGLGAVLYFCLTGRKPFEVPDPAALTYVPLVSLPAPPSTWRDGVPEGLDRLVLTLLARQPSRRPSSLDRIDKALRASLRTPAASPVLGMHDERDQLRRAVVGASDGECRVVVVYGPPGCGRTTLIGEAFAAARREGLTEEASQGVPVVALEASDEALARISTVLSRRTPGLYLLRSERPLPSLGRAIQITPPPLPEDDAARLVRSLGGDFQHASRWWRETLGHPVALVGRVHAAIRGDAAPDPGSLPDASRRVLDRLRALGPTGVPELAAALSLTPHALLDHCEALFAGGFVEADDDGGALRVVG